MHFFCHLKTTYFAQYVYNIVKTHKRFPLGLPGNEYDCGYYGDLLPVAPSRRRIVELLLNCTHATGSKSPQQQQFGNKSRNMTLQIGGIPKIQSIKYANSKLQNRLLVREGTPHN
jgi:hypothetical protein